MAEVSRIAHMNRRWILTLLLGVVATLGWGAFGYSAYFAAVTQQQLRQEVADVSVSRDERAAERNKARSELNAAREQLASVKTALEQTTAQRNELRTQLDGAREAFTKLQGQSETTVRETGSVLKRLERTPPKAQTKPR